MTTRQASTSTMSAEDEQFRRRIQGAIEAVKAWDANAELLKQVRESIPFSDLCNNGSKFSRPEDAVLEPTVRFVQRLSRYFKDKMTWINQPACQQCSKGGVRGANNKDNAKSMEPQATRGPETEEEKAGQASRVEVYKCAQCQQLATFPRYNKVSKLFETHAGRCGEYANLFGLYCRAVGFETRYIHDVTDHVWTEVYIPNHGGGDTNSTSGEPYWMMVDSCEGVIDETSMYEAGWGKKLSYMIAVSTTHVVDVSPKYTRHWNEGDFQARRRAITSSESAGEQILQQMNNAIKLNKTPKETEQTDRRLKREAFQLRQERIQHAWEHQYGRGRISGSLAWKSQRQEDGNRKDAGGKGVGSKKDAPAHFHVETYFLVATNSSNKDGNHVSIAVRPNPVIRHEAIQVNGVACATGVLKSLSVVVVDHEYLGCILQSRCCLTLQQLLDFVETVPANRIVVVTGSIPNANKKNDSEEDGDESSRLIAEKLSRQLGGFDATILTEDRILYVGQVLAKPDWAVCCGAKHSPFGFILEAAPNASLPKERTLKTIPNFRSASVVGRVPESIMPLQTQKLASHKQKRDAFLSLVKEHSNKKTPCSNYAGYTTAPGLPVYLLGETAYPLTQTEAAASLGNQVDHNVWTTFLLLPPPLVAEDDIGIPDEDTEADNNGAPSFEVPVDNNFFVQNIGPQLLTNKGQGQSKISTVDALQNTRFVAFYFSAHWCGPCRTFTPMLVEMYAVLKEAYPTHGLEMVFVSSDRDAASFGKYFATMPWLAIPFESLATYKQMLSFTYGVRGIPSLVILDSMSGQIVAPNEETRQQVMQACRGGDNAIEAMFQTTWMDRIPAESKQLLDMLQLSCNEDALHKNGESDEASNKLLDAYLVRKEITEAEERMKTLVTQLVEDGVEVNEAEESARAIEEMANEETENDNSSELEAGPLNNVFTRRLLDGATSLTFRDKTSPMFHAEHIAMSSGKDTVVSVLSAALKYLDNCIKEPWNPKYRQFQLSNKFADRVTKVPSGLLLLESLGFAVYGTMDDYMASIPIYADPEAMRQSMNQMLEQFSSAVQS